MRRNPELAVWVAFALWSLVPVVLLLAGEGEVFNGSDGLQIDDHMQYLAFVRDAGDNVLFSNRFDVVSDPHLFFHPMFALSGLFLKLGASVQLAYLLWKPVTVIALLVGFTLYVRRMLGPDRGPVLAGLVLALFFLTPAAALVDWFDYGDGHVQFGSVLVGLETYAGGYVWGGYPGTISVAMMPLFLLGIERVLEPERRAEGRSQLWYGAWAGVAGMLASWLHPWQGMTLLLMVGGLVAWDRLRRRNLSLALPVALTAAPLAYFFILSRTDSSWEYVSRENNFDHMGVWFVLGFLPALLAAPAYFKSPGEDVQERLLRLWPVAAMVLFFALQQGWFYHAFAALSLPLAVLAVRSWRRVRIPRAAWAAGLAAMTIFGLVYMVLELEETRSGHFMDGDVRQALAYIDDSPRPGAVLARQEIGMTVPAFTGRNTWVGHYNWTPEYDTRLSRAADLFSGRLDQGAATRVVEESRASFLLAGCEGSDDLRPLLGSMLVEARRFGCATVYEVRPSARQAQSVPFSTPRRAEAVSYPARSNALRAASSKSPEGL